MLVRFSDPDEFVTDLARDPEAVARKLVRITNLSYPIFSGALTRVAVVGTAKVASGDVDFDLVEYRRVVGDLGAHRGNDDEVRTKAREQLDELQRKLEDAGFAVGAGRYELPDDWPAPPREAMTS